MQLNAGYAFLTPFNSVYHMAFVYGRIGDGKNVLTRLHRANIIADVFGGAKPIHQALARFQSRGQRRADFAPRWHCGRTGRFYTEVRRHRVG